MAAKPEQRPGLCLSLRTTLEWAQELTAPGGESEPLPLDRLADLRRIAPRTLREHLARLEGLGLLTRVYAGQAGLSIHVTQEERDDSPDAGREGECVPCPAEGPTGQPVSAQVLESVSLLSRAGVYPQLARSLARKPWVTPDLIAGWVYELRHIRAVRALAAVLVHTLQDPERCLPPPEMPAGTPNAGRRLDPCSGEEVDACQAPSDECRRPDGDEREAQGMRSMTRLTASSRTSAFSLPSERKGARVVHEGQSAGYRADAADSDVRSPPGRLERVQLSRPREESADHRPGFSARAPEHAVLWEAVHRALASRLPAEMDALWLRRARALSYSDGVLIVAVPTTIGAEWLNLAGAPRARDAIQQVAGTRLVVRFVPAGLREHASD